MKFDIDKQFDFCYGHRVWSQELDTTYSLDGCLACRHLHGHQGTVKVHLVAKDTHQGMVTDFKHLNWFKKWLDDYFDHKMIFDTNDPLIRHEVPELVSMVECSEEDLFNNSFIKDCNGFKMIDMIKFEENLYSFYPDLEDKTRKAIIEKYEGLVFVNFIPTSENLCKFFLEQIGEKMQGLLEVRKGRVEVESVEFWETPKSHCKVTKG